jgi:hypothetical protein
MSISYWERQPTDQPYTLNGFNGTWNFSDHNLIPEPLRNFIIEMFPKIEKFKRIPLEDINALMNDVWEGPGSMPKLMRMMRDKRAERVGKNDISVQTLSQDDVKTIDDYSDEEKVNFANDNE